MKGTFLLLFVTQIIWATGNQNQYLTPKDTVIVDVNIDGHKIFKHIIAPKQTLYSLAKFYKLDVYAIYDFNPWLRSKVLGVGDTVSVPIQEQLILKDEEQLLGGMEYALVYYQVKKQDNLYQIAKRHFNIPVETLKNRNNIPDHNLSIGQNLLIGWFDLYGGSANPAQNIHPSTLHLPVITKEENLKPISNIPLGPPKPNKEEIALLNKPIEPAPALSRTDEATGKSEPLGIDEEIEDLKANFEIEKAHKISYVFTEQRGVAAWRKDIREKTDLYAIHRTAPVGSTVMVSNPLIKKSVYAKVISQMPEDLYPDNVCVVVSPAVANLLGAVDAHFFVKVRYLSPQIKP